MQRDTFNFFLYRLNKEYRHDLFSQVDKSFRTDDEWMQMYFQSVCKSEFDFKKETPVATTLWSLRNYQDLDEDFSSIVLAKSQVQKTGTIVTDNSLTYGDSVSNPPSANTIILLFYWPRHIVVVENRAAMTNGQTWLRHFHNILRQAQTTLSNPVMPVLEPIPPEGTILSLLSSLNRVFRLRVRLKLPNPELNYYAKEIYDEMVEQKLTEYMQEFISPDGIRVDKQSRVYRSVALAELGYKGGGIQIDGEDKGEVVHIDEGKTAIKGSADQLRSFVRGLEVNAQGKQHKNSLKRIKSEIDRLFPHHSA